MMHIITVMALFDGIKFHGDIGTMLNSYNKHGGCCNCCLDVSALWATLLSTLFFPLKYFSSSYLADLHVDAAVLFQDHYLRTAMLDTAFASILLVIIWLLLASWSMDGEIDLLGLFCHQNS